MIYIESSPTADSRTAPDNTTKEQLLESSKMHIDDVRQGLDFFAEMLHDAGEKHDHTKIEYIDEFYHDFSQRLKGDEFKKAPWFQMHLTERHHLTDRVPDDVNLIDVLERIADICMAGMARSGKVYDDTLDPAILERAYQNTIQLLLKNIQVVDEKRVDAIKSFASQMNAGETK